MGDIILKTKKLTKKYGKDFAVNNVDLELKQGDIYGLVGKNGAGKTTILRMISGLSIPTSGEIELFNETSKAGLNNSRTKLGCMVETPSFFKYLSAKKNLEYYRLQRGVVEKECVDKAIKMVGLEDAGKKKFKNFSLGMKQRLGLALAIMTSPDLLILDEPTNGLDPTGIIELRELLLRFNRERNTTIIISSHILSELSQLANTYGFINKGEFVEQISAKNLEEKCRRHLLIKVDDTSKATVIIENKLESMEYEVLNRNEIRLYQHIDTPEIVSEALINNGIKLFSINNSGVNLEEYFVDLIGGNKHD
ncbi:ABC transporter ATP-binding protein [Clostridium sp. CM028]|uniref:ABC transporter ATP-binding protein n=1 Tax=unclassified Clostridium TaxID=2614128 RepID=UPI001C0D5F44|nr:MULTISPECIES: ABC transporter ATP-binding protein [unclassified Clostridium]MBU3092533.1 ABC transporter ATP-binding protein [Clostridium sp. CF011]MBW9150049.1 ABC transporter ATP-binding protein [Clostridium sp. CM028]WAG68778.1 ABC transporter ATP-binding protein [Clostridium sp. CF011]WLC60552.1 ABC transporter ATP-binding protein [Clostridium sp. CM028]